MDTLIIYEAGLRTEAGKYHNFISSTCINEVEDYIEIVKVSKPESMSIIFIEKTYHLVSTTPHIVE